MTFENRPPINYFKLKDGKVEVYKGKNDDGTKKVERFDQYTGKITNIEVRTGEYQGEEIKSWNITLHDNSDVAVLSLGYSSGFTRSFFNCLANADLSKPIRISCYVKTTDTGEWNSPSLSQGGELLKWKYEDMPKTEIKRIGSKKVIDDEEALEWMLKIVDEIQEKLKEIKPESPKTLSDDDVAPPDFEDDGMDKIKEIFEKDGKEAPEPDNITSIDDLPFDTSETNGK